VSAHCRFLLPVSERNVAFDELEMSEIRLRRPIGVMLLGIRGEKVGVSSGKLSPALFRSRSRRFRSACQALALVIFRRLEPRRTRIYGELLLVEEFKIRRQDGLLFWVFYQTMWEQQRK
jgi:hypothetical protein